MYWRLLTRLQDSPVSWVLCSRSKLLFVSMKSNVTQRVFIVETYIRKNSVKIITANVDVSSPVFYLIWNQRYKNLVNKFWGIFFSIKKEQGWSFLYLFFCKKKLSENTGIPWRASQRKSLLWQYGIVTGFLRQFVMLKWNHCKVILLIECGFNEMV